MKGISVCTLVTACTLLIAEAHAEPVGIGGVHMGMSPNEVIKDPAVQCRFRGMTYKYNVCQQIESIANIPVKTEYYFDKNALEMMSMFFEGKSYESVLSLLEHKYGNIHQVTDDGWIRWDLAEGEILLDTVLSRNNLAELRIFDNKAIERFKNLLQDHQYNKHDNAESKL
jgi:hypothetical protein